MFLQASRENLEKGMLVWNQFALAFGLHINWRKSNLISCTERDLEFLRWQGSVVKKDSIFRHLGYPLGMNVTNGQLIEWMSSKLRDKFMYWKSQSWSFHVRLKIVQCVMEPMILFTCHCCHGQRRLCLLFCNLVDICCGRRGTRWEAHRLRGII